MNLDEQLKNIVRPERSQQQKESTKIAIYKRIEHEKKKFNWQYSFVAISSLAILLFLVATITISPTKHEQTAQQPFGNINESTTIKEMIVLENKKPNKELNLKSIFYPLKRSTMDAEVLSKIMPILLNAKEHAQPWYGHIQNEHRIYDLHFTFSNGEELYLKLGYEEFSNEFQNYLIDPVSKMKYDIPPSEYKLIQGTAYNLLDKGFFNKGKLIRFLVYILLASVILRYIDKKERLFLGVEEKKREFSWTSFGISLIGILLINILINHSATIHYGMGLILIVFSMAILSIKKYIKLKSIKTWKFDLLSLLVSLIFITAVIYF